MHPSRPLRLIALLLPFVTLASRAAGDDDLTALDRYVATPDMAYSWKLVETRPSDDHTVFILEMTSQSWLTENEVNRTLWKHWMTVIRPSELKTTKSLLFITGGANGRAAPRSTPKDLVAIAKATNSVVTELRMVPNQPLVFNGDGKQRSEDSLIAYSWDKYLRSGDEKWPARLPMTKAAVRAMDTVTAFCATPGAGNLRIDAFVVAGASKRGWTTWTTAAVDRRVVAIIPIVIDMLNVEPSFVHHFRAYGFYAPAVGDYEDMKIMDWQGTPQYRALMKIEEPYEYRHRLTIPKFIINAAGDQFFLPDSWRFYFQDLPGPKYLRYVPNADHSLKGSDAVETLLACYHAILNDAKLPEFSWKQEEDGTLRVTTKDKPRNLMLWQAHNPKARDFRLETLGPVWRSSNLSPEADGSYAAKVDAPASGWTAYLVELTYPSGGPTPYKFTTGVYVTPDTLPHEFHKRLVREQPR
jgi:PhoPQ-activated pathogenicity-related protein